MPIETVNIRDSYKWYKENHVHPRVDIKVYMHIVTGFMKFLGEKILDGFQVKLGGGDSLGTLAVVGKRPKVRFEGDKIMGLAPDWSATKKMWAEFPELKEKKQLVFYTNDHTNGIRYNLVWWKTGMKIGNKYLYTFVFCKPMKRALSKLLREGKEYLVYH